MMLNVSYYVLHIYHTNEPNVPNVGKYTSSIRLVCNHSRDSHWNHCDQLRNSNMNPRNGSPLEDQRHQHHASWNLKEGKSAVFSHYFLTNPGEKWESLNRPPFFQKRNPVGSWRGVSPRRKDPGWNEGPHLRWKSVALQHPWRFLNWWG